MGPSFGQGGAGGSRALAALTRAALAAYHRDDERAATRPCQSRPVVRDGPRTAPLWIAEACRVPPREVEGPARAWSDTAAVPLDPSRGRLASHNDRNCGPSRTRRGRPQPDALLSTVVVAVIGATGGIWRYPNARYQDLGVAPDPNIRWPDIRIDLLECEGDERRYTHPSCCIVAASFQIFVMWRILSPSKSMSYT
jgi:hypothetical protein